MINESEPQNNLRLSDEYLLLADTHETQIPPDRGNKGYKINYEIYYRLLNLERIFFYVTKFKDRIKPNSSERFRPISFKEFITDCYIPKLNQAGLDTSMAYKLLPFANNSRLWLDINLN